ncbi:MAG: 50S ribosomal protein L30 [Nitrospirae bacterium]|jgi:large subunit ribosomal protein L30|nr:50S ribosomal protein L30 [Nitrospirota bacterium]
MAKSAASSKNLSITLKRSPIGTSYRHRLVLQGLGLRKPHQTVVRPDTPQVRGLVGKVSYLLEVKVQ